MSASTTPIVANSFFQGFSVPPQTGIDLESQLVTAQAALVSLQSAIANAQAASVAAQAASSAAVSGTTTALTTINTAAAAAVTSVNAVIGTTEVITHKGQPNGYAGLNAAGAVVASGAVISGPITLSMLPTVEPPSGSGIVWNNGGVLCAA